MTGFGFRAVPLLSLMVVQDLQPHYLTRNSISTELDRNQSLVLALPPSLQVAAMMPTNSDSLNLQRIFHAETSNHASSPHDGSLACTPTTFLALRNTSLETETYYSTHIDTLCQSITA